jgi:hypothetical protein
MIAFMSKHTKFGIGEERKFVFLSPRTPPVMVLSFSKAYTLMRVFEVVNTHNRTVVVSVVGRIDVTNY